MAYIKSNHILKWYMKWGGIRMSTDFCNKRLAYTNNEIVSLFNSKLQSNGDDAVKLAKYYCVDVKTIELMKDRTCEYNYDMLKIATNYIGIPYDELIAIISDDEDGYSLRANDTEDAKELHDILCYLFDEMINQERLVMV